MLENYEKAESYEATNKTSSNQIKTRALANLSNNAKVLSDWELGQLIL